VQGKAAALRCVLASHQHEVGTKYISDVPRRAVLADRLGQLLRRQRLAEGDTNGESYKQGLGTARSPDVQRRAAKLVATLGPRIDTVNQWAAKKFGWTGHQKGFWNDPAYHQEFKLDTVPGPRQTRRRDRRQVELAAPVRRGVRAEGEPRSAAPAVETARGVAGLCAGQPTL
jgi:hypothetical protein